MNPIQTSTNPSTSYSQTLAPQSSYTHSTSETIKNTQHGKRKHATIEPLESYGNKTLKHDLLKPKVPVTIYHIQWTPPTIEARSDLARLHHRELTPEQQRSSVLNTLLTEHERLNLFSLRCPCINYKSRRIVYITSQQKEEKPLCNSEKMWNDLFTSKLSEIPSLPEPTTVEDKTSVRKIKYCRNVLLKYLDSSTTKLFVSLENGTINYEDYCILRSTVCKFANKKLSPIKSPYFPSIRTCNNTQYLTHTKFYNPMFLLASKAFLQIRPIPAHCEQLLSTKSKVILQKFYEGSFQSIMELEAAASSLSHMMNKISIRPLINNAIAIMEQKNILPTTSNINDLTTHPSHQVPSTSSKHIQQRPPSTQSQKHETDTTSKYKTTVSQCTTIKTVNVIQRPKVKIKNVNDPTLQYEDGREQHDYNTDISSKKYTSENMPTIQQKDSYNTSHQLSIPLEATRLLPIKETSSLLLINKTKSTTTDIPIQRSISQQITTLQLIIADDQPITPSITVNDTPQTATSIDTMPETLATTSIIRNDIIDKTEDIPTCTIEEHPTSPELIVVDDKALAPCSTSIQIVEILPDQEESSSITSHSTKTPGKIVTRIMAKATNISKHTTTSIVRRHARNTTRRTISRRHRTSRSTAITNAIITRLVSGDSAQYASLQHLQVSTAIDQQATFLSVLGLKPNRQ